jgi:biopolymer transport protein ExbD
MAFGKAHTRGHIVAEINVTPLTDVFLVLLIIFMITTSAMVKPAADVDLPKAAADEEESRGVMVTMTPSREVYVNERPVGADDATLAAALKDALEHSSEKVVILAGDRQVVLGEVVRVLGLAKEAGASGFALASE